MLPPTYVERFHSKDSLKKMSYRRLGETDMIVSKFGYGAAALGKVYKDVINDESENALVLGLKSGINFIDTAPWYGQGHSEQRLGNILKCIPRSSVYIATKVGRYELDPKKMFDFSAEKTISSVERSLQLLKLDYIDLIQTLPALLELKARGKVKYIGITSYNLNVLKKMVRLCPPKTLDTVLSYAKLNILNQELLDDIDFFRSKGIGVINAAPTAMGLLTESGIPDWHPALPNLKKVCAEAAAYCKERGFDLAYLAVLWAFNRSEVSTTLVSSPTPSIMAENLSMFLNKELLPKDLNMLKELKVKFFDPLPIVNWELVEICKYFNQL